MIGFCVGDLVGDGVLPSILAQLDKSMSFLVCCLILVTDLFAVCFNDKVVNPMMSSSEVMPITKH